MRRISTLVHCTPVRIVQLLNSFGAPLVHPVNLYLCQGAGMQDSDVLWADQGLFRVAPLPGPVRGDGRGAEEGKPPLPLPGQVLLEPHLCSVVKKISPLV